MYWSVPIVPTRTTYVYVGTKNGMERGRKRKEEGGGTKGGEVMTAVTAVVTVTRFTFWRKGLLRIRVCIIAKTREQTPGVLVSFPRAISLWTSGQD